MYNRNQQIKQTEKIFWLFSDVYGSRLSNWRGIY